MRAKLLKDIRDESGDTELFVPAGTVIDLLDSMGEGAYLAAAPDSEIWFAVQADEIEILPEPAEVQ